MECWIELKYASSGVTMTLARLEDIEVLRFLKNYVLNRQELLIHKAQSVDPVIAADMQAEFDSLEKRLNLVIPNKNSTEVPHGNKKASSYFINHEKGGKL